MQHQHWYIGCSGFSYREWEGIFYPDGLPQKDWFAYYAEHFNTVELNVTFYRFPVRSSLQGWYKKSPADFLFSVKVPKIITHQKRFTDTAPLLKQFYEVLRSGLEEKTGPVLFQLPPGMAYSPGVLQTILQQTDPSFTNVIEFRHTSWWCSHVLEEPSRYNVSFCGVSYPLLPDNAATNTQLSYHRFHGVPKLYYSMYDDYFLTQIVKTISKAPVVKKAFLYFNNTASAAALENAGFVQNIVPE